MSSAADRDAAWPSLPLEAWSDTAATLHMWFQIEGKVRLVQSPWPNHSWHVTRYVGPQGLTTTPNPDGTRSVERTFDDISHQPAIETRDGRAAPEPLA